ncbi:uncharacterized protein BYT42DRAFT_639272, partial [Radiomyces spectabilis]|uniref:uncharacterized protein n=1 Tax=Radiomyces spectabilis TaxID=64574 RepID=UPI00221ECBD5
LIQAEIKTVTLYKTVTYTEYIDDDGYDSSPVTRTQTSTALVNEPATTSMKGVLTTATPLTTMSDNTDMMSSSSTSRLNRNVDPETSSGSLMATASSKGLPSDMSASDSSSAIFAAPTAHTPSLSMTKPSGSKSASRSAGGNRSGAGGNSAFTFSPITLAPESTRSGDRSTGLHMMTASATNRNSTSSNGVNQVSPPVFLTFLGLISAMFTL